MRHTPPSPVHRVVHIGSPPFPHSTGRLWWMTPLHWLEQLDCRSQATAAAGLLLYKAENGNKWIINQKQKWQAPLITTPQLIIRPIFFQNKIICQRFHGKRNDLTIWSLKSRTLKRMKNTQKIMTYKLINERILIFLLLKWHVDKVIFKS